MTYPVDSDQSAALRYTSFQQPGPDFFSKSFKICQNAPGRSRFSKARSPPRLPLFYILTAQFINE